MSAPGLFIAGTDTGVGKTWFTTRLLVHLRGLGRDAVGMKPVECGGRDDALAIRLASGGETAPPLDEINPYPLADPLAPAAMSPPPPLDFGRILACHARLAAEREIVLVEGAGGWLVPLDRRRTMADLALALGLPVLVVAANRLGTLSHTLLTVRTILASGLECRGVILNDLPGGEPDLSRASNARVLREQLPDLAVLEGDPGQVAGLL
jgi:dethiobiotin synthetase